jgi:hypothetical protein
VLSANRQLRNLLIGTPLAGLTGWLLARAGVPGEVAYAVVTPAVAGLPTLVHEAIVERRTPSEVAVQNLIQGGIERNPLGLFILLTVALLVTERLFIIIVAVCLAFVLLVVGGGEVQLNFILSQALLVSYAAVPFMALVALVLGKYCAHRITHVPIAWLLASMVTVVAVDVGLAVLTFSILHLEIPVGGFAWLYGVALALLALAVLIGIRWARRVHEAYLMKRLVSRSRPQDRRALIDLTNDLLNSARPTGP